MINIYKLIKSVKEGKLSSNFFNLKIKKAAEDTVLDELIRREEEELREKKIREQEQQKAKQIVTDPMITPGRTISQPSQQIPQQIPSDFSFKVDLFISRNRNDLEALVGDRNPDRRKEILESPSFLAETGLYNAIKNNKAHEEYLIKRIYDETNVKDPKVINQLVQFLKARSKSIQTQLDAVKMREDEEARARSAKDDEALAPGAEQAAAQLREKGYIEKAEEELLRKEQVQTDQSGAEVNIKDYSQAVSWADPHLEWNFERKWGELTPEEMSSAKSILGVRVIDEDPSFKGITPELSNAAQYKLGAPEGYVDQRMNFFLAYPEHLNKVMDDSLMAAFSIELPKMGALLESNQVEDITRGIHSVLNDLDRNSKSHGIILNILNNEKGQELYGILKSLIEEANPDIFKWLSATANKKNKTISFDAGVEDKGIANMGLASETPTGKKDPVTDIWEQHEGSQVLGKIGAKYFTPMLENARVVMSGAFTPFMNDSVEQFRKMQAEPNPTTVVEKKLRVDHERQKVEEYDIAEALNAFGIPIIDHINELFSLKHKRRGDLESDDPIFALFKNQKGEIDIPENVLQDILKPISKKDGEEGYKEEEIFSTSDYGALAERYLKRIKDGKVAPYIPDWGKLVSNSYMVKTFEDMGKLKEVIRAAAKNAKSKPGEDVTGNIRVHYENQIAPFAGVSQDDPENVKRKKIEDFIYMTLAQSSGHISWLQKLGSRKGKELKSKASYHSLKAFIQFNSYKAYGYMINKKEAAEYLIEQASKDIFYQPTPEEIQMVNESDNYTHEALSSVMGVLGDHSDMRNFLKNGSAINAVDKKHRTNTELYYALMGVDPPEAVKTLIGIYKDGLQKSNVIDKVTQEKKIEKGSWFDILFKEYAVFDAADRAKDGFEVSAKRHKELIEEHYQLYNNKILKLLQHPKINPPDAKYKAILRSIAKKNSVLAEEVNQTIRVWLENTKKHLPDDLYETMGYKGFKKGLQDMISNKDNAIAKYEARKIEQQESAKKLNVMLINSGYPSQDIKSLQSALRIVSSAYKRALIKIAALERMKKHSFKFSFVNSINFLDLQIIKVKTDFDHYFNSLFL